ncbi:MAG TPA: DUF952 domain-containing protein, partial [Aggregatilineales bacterium]|nr:DUF952 domain-containing protein [Aggregatilineales bacterium]
DRLIDLRVDDHEDPVVRLQELMALHDLYFGKSDPASRIPITSDLAVELQSLLVRLGYQQGPITSTWDEAAREAFWRFVGQENFEERWSPGEHPELIDPVLLDFIRRHFGAHSGKSGVGSEYSGYARQFPADIIYHITRAEYYAAQPPDRPYLPEAYAKDGFIHCTRGADLMATVANKHYRRTPGDFLMLVLSTRALTSPLKYESFDAELPFPFPHIYGPINRDAILEVVKMKRASDGTFLVPPFADEHNSGNQRP